MKYGYASAQIQSTIEVKKGDTVKKYSDKSVKELYNILEKRKFIKGKIIIKHREKMIQLTRSPYTNDLNFETNFSPSPEFKKDVMNLFNKIKPLKVGKK